MVAPTQITKIKQSNLNLIKSGKIEGTKFKAYERLLNSKGSSISKGRLKGAKMLYLGGVDYIGALIITYKGGGKKVHHLQAEIDA